MVSGCGQGRTYDDATVSAALTLYAEGFRPVDVEKIVGMKAYTVGWWARQAGIQRSLKEAIRLSHQLRHGNPRGYIDDGYRILKFDGKKIPEHRFIMEQTLGRSLRPDENVHHKNGVRSDNRAENLELWVERRQPKGQRVQDRVQDALETLARYAGEYV